MDAPENCPPGVYSVIRICWEEDPRRRPTFHKLREKLEREMGLQSPVPGSACRGDIKSGSVCRSQS